MHLRAEGDARRIVIEIVVIGVVAVFTGVIRNVVASKQYRLSWIRETPRVRIVQPRAIEQSLSPLSSRRAEREETSAAREQVSIQTKSKPQSQTTEVAVVDREFTPHPETPYVELSPSDIDVLYARNALFIDARRTSSYEEGHVAGALSMPVGESDLNERLTAIANERDPAEVMVLYCNGGHCGDSYELAQRLWGVGFNNLYIYKDGIPDWMKRARPVRTGRTP